MTNINIENNYGTIYITRGDNKENIEPPPRSSSAILEDYTRRYNNYQNTIIDAQSTINRIRYAIDQSLIGKPKQPLIKEFPVGSSTNAIKHLKKMR